MDILQSIQWYDQIRLMTVLISLGAVVRSSQRALKLWKIYTSRLKDLWFAMTVLMIFLIEYNVEQILKDVSFGPSVLAGFALSLIAFRAQMKEEGYLKTERRDPPS